MTSRKRRPTGGAKATGLRQGLATYGDAGFSLFLRKAFIKAGGYSDDALDRPIVGITNTFSDYNPCHGNVPDLIEAVKRGVMLAGALPMVFPTVSIHESFSHPTSMFLRNLMAMDTEEMIRAQPMDSVVLLGGCDKTVPAQLMGAVSADLPAVQLVAGPMMTGRYKGERLGACTDCRRFWARFRGGEIDAAEIAAVEGNLATTAGTCAVMGTASTMACVAEALGLALPDSATIPAVHADRLRCAEESGRRAVALIGSELTPRRIVTAKSVENALRVILALSGSTNAILHLAAIAGRAGLDLSLERLNALSETTPVLVDLKPVGDNYMEDFHAAGGLDAVLRELKPLLHLDCMTVTGETLGERLDRKPTIAADRRVVHAVSDPIAAKGGLVALFGSLAPGGAIVKRAAADPRLLEHEGRAVVFDSLEDLARRIDDPELDVAADDVLVLQNAGPKSASGMPEAGYLPIPKKLARQGVKDMVRVSDARMSGTAFGTIVLHVTPEATVGGPLSIVSTGDRIRLSVAERRIDLLVDDAEIARRLAERAGAVEQPVAAPPGRGYDLLYRSHVLQADRGCDFDFLRGDRAD